MMPVSPIASLDKDELRAIQYYREFTSNDMTPTVLGSFNEACDRCFAFADWIATAFEKKRQGEDLRQVVRSMRHDFREWHDQVNKLSRNDRTAGRKYSLLHVLYYEVIAQLSAVVLDDDRCYEHETEAFGNIVKHVGDYIECDGDRDFRNASHRSNDAVIVTALFLVAWRLSHTELDTLLDLSVNKAKRSSLWNLVDVLFQSAQLPLLRLHSPKSDRSATRLVASIQQKRDILACFYNNNFALSLSHRDGATARGVFPTIARLNHSCIPNAQGNFNSNVAEGSFTIHALRDIPAGEEITVSYLHDELASQDERQQWLHQVHELSKAFTPTSPLHSGSLGISGRSNPVVRDAGTIDIGTGRRLVSLAIETYEQEGLAGGELASLYEVAAGLADSAGDHGEALRLGARSMELQRDASGEDSPLYQMRRRSFECMKFEVGNSTLSRVVAAPNTQSPEDENALSYAPWT
ncbi:hypothetical protein DV737_g1047, partial [Chaetothyriales sp. CBS 132003]